MARKRKVKAPPYQSDKTRWAYWMQGIEPTSEAINRAFPQYHPTWVRHSQDMTVGAENFVHLRRNMLGLSQEKTAAYLRLGVKKIRAWETGKARVPFMAFELLRLVYESTAFRMSHARWDGWFIDREGRLVSPDVGGRGALPEDFAVLPYLKAERDSLREENVKLRKTIGQLERDIARLQSLAQNRVLAQEVAAMQARLSGLVGALQTGAAVVQFPTQKRKAAA